MLPFRRGLRESLHVSSSWVGLEEGGADHNILLVVILCLSMLQLLNYELVLNKLIKIESVAAQYH